VAAVTSPLDLASDRLGGIVLAASDDFFAPKERLISAADPVWREGEYTDRGKWMDGWESRRRRDLIHGDPGFDLAHDWAVVQLASHGIIRAVDVETTHFRGNHPESCSIETCVMPGATSMYDLHRATWQPALDRRALRGDAHNTFDLAGVEATHVRLNIFPDGGVARLHVFSRI